MARNLRLLNDGLVPCSEYNLAGSMRSKAARLTVNIENLHAKYRSNIITSFISNIATGTYHFFTNVIRVKHCNTNLMLSMRA